jgi:hypothetical protein
VRSKEDLLREIRRFRLVQGDMRQVVAAAQALHREHENGDLCRALETAIVVCYGVTRAAAEAIMRQLPFVQFEGLRKIYVRRSDVARLIGERTLNKA